MVLWSSLQSDLSAISASENTTIKAGGKFQNRQDKQYSISIINNMKAY